jgi:hypothetical protein
MCEENCLEFVKKKKKLRRQNTPKTNFRGLLDAISFFFKIRLPHLPTVFQLHSPSPI